MTKEDQRRVVVKLAQGQPIPGWEILVWAATMRGKIHPHVLRVYFN